MPQLAEDLVDAGDGELAEAADFDLFIFLLLAEVILLRTPPG